MVQVEIMITVSSNQIWNRQFLVILLQNALLILCSSQQKQAEKKRDYISRYFKFQIGFERCLTTFSNLDFNANDDRRFLSQTFLIFSHQALLCPPKKAPKTYNLKLKTLIYREILLAPCKIVLRPYDRVRRTNVMEPSNDPAAMLAHCAQRFRDLPKRQCWNNNARGIGLGPYASRMSLLDSLINSSLQYQERKQVEKNKRGLKCLPICAQ